MSEIDNLQLFSIKLCIHRKIDMLLEVLSITEGTERLAIHKKLKKWNTRLNELKGNSNENS